MGESLIKCCCNQKNEIEILKGSINNYPKTKEEFCQTDLPGDYMNLNKFFDNGNSNNNPNIVKNSDIVKQKKQIYVKNDPLVYETNINIINSNLYFFNNDDDKKENINKQKKDNEKKKPIDIDIKKVRDEFCVYIFENINKIRTNPKFYIEYLKDCKKYIIEENDKFYYKKNVNNKILLKEGQKSFDDAIEYLENLESMNKLNFDNNLNIPLPNTKKELKDSHYLKNMVDNLIKKGIRIKCYWKIYDINIQDVCLLMMILDENDKNKNIRNAILNKNMKKIGINSFTIENSFACYILLSDY